MRDISFLFNKVAAYKYELIGAAMKAASILIGLCTTIILSRGLGVDDFGRFSAIQAALYLCIAIAKFGGPSLIVRETAIARKTDSLGTINGVFRVTRYYVIALFIFAGLVALLIPYLPFTQNMGLIGDVSLLLLTVIWAWTTLSLWNALIRGFGRVLIGQSAELLVRPGVFLVIIATIFLIPTSLELTLHNSIVAFSLSAFAAFVFSLVWLIRLPRPEITPFIPWRTWGKNFLQFGGLAIVGGLALQLETLLLAALSTPDEIAYFKLAAQIGLLTTFGFGVVNLQFAPSIAGYIASQQTDELQRIAIRSSRFSSMFALPVFIIVVVLGVPNISYLFGYLFGPGFTSAAKVLIVIVFAQLINAGCGSVALILNSGGHQASVLAVRIFTLIIGAVLNVTLIPKFGALGAAISFAAALIVWNFVLTVLVWKIYRVISLPFHFGKKRS